jgi:cytochrome d ubiquinol oxidase subunit II
LVELWFYILCFMLIMFAVLEGWDFGAGALHLIVGKTPAERREVIAAIGPLWSWHEVWLVGAGGTFMVAFPKAMATAFSGYYLALWLALWAFMLRGISIEVGGHLGDPLWQSFWDFVFAVANFALAIVFGAALGNVIRGVPIDETGRFSLAFFTDFGVRGRVGILDWYTLSVALETLLLLGAHGATYLTLKSTGAVHARSHAAARWLWIAAGIGFPIVSGETWWVRPALFSSILARPLGWIALLAVGGGVALLIVGRRTGREWVAFAGSCAFIAGLLAALAVGTFPVLLFSTLGSQFSMTAYGAASNPRGLKLALFWWPLAIALAFTYVAFIARQFRGKITASEVNQGYGDAPPSAPPAAAAEPKDRSWI